MADEDEDSANVATVELNILSAEGLKDKGFFGIKMKKSFVVAWVDPRLKKSTQTLTTRNPFWNTQLSFPLHPQTLQNPSSILTVQVLSSHSRVVGSSILPISAIREDIDTLTSLQLWRPSGRAQGLLRVSVRIAANPRVLAYRGCVTGIPVERDSARSVSFPSWDVARESDCYNPVLPTTGESGCYNRVLPTAPPMPAESDNPRRNFLIGLLSGAVAAVLVGSAVI